MAEKRLQSTFSSDSGLGGGSMRQGGQAAAGNNANQAEGGDQESLHFDAGTGSLVVRTPNEEQRVGLHRPAAPGRVVVNEMASQGFFIS